VHHEVAEGCAIWVVIPGPPATGHPQKGLTKISYGTFNEFLDLTVRHLVGTSEPLQNDRLKLCERSRE
jgi:hypothetical protein